MVPRVPMVPMVPMVTIFHFFPPISVPLVMFVTFLLPPMVMVMVMGMAKIMALVMVNGLYTKFEDIYFFPHQFST